MNVVVEVNPIIVSNHYPDEWRGAVKQLIDLLGADDRQMRLMAIDHLGKMGDRRAIRALRACMRAKDPAVWEAAGRAIENIKSGKRSVFYLT